MSGIYIHIPFCKQSCSYCDFHFSTSLKHKNALIDAVIKELEEKRYQLKQEVNTIYFGGGTPSLLNTSEISRIMEAIYKNYRIANSVEFTLECNPDDLTHEKVGELKTAGVNRLSIGVQSFFNDDLQLFNRAHNADEAEASIKLSQDLGLENITIDLIYGSPLMTNEKWFANLQKVKEFTIPHLSCYGLTVEPKTALAHQISTGKLKPLNDRNAIAHYQILVTQTKQMGLIQYEVSNFGKEGYFSQHNSNYWKGEEYLGIGPSAHSFLKIPSLQKGAQGLSKRIWNVANNIKYINALNKKEDYYNEEIIDERTAYNEYLLTRLRTIWGIDLDYISVNFSEQINIHFRKEIEAYSNSSYLQQLKNKVVLTDEGMLLADKITSDLFYVE